MPELRTYALTCPGCGADVKVGQTVDTFACLYCGVSVRVERGDGIVSLSLITDAISKVQRGTDRTAAELALLRIPKEIELQRSELDSINQKINTLADEIRVASTPPTGSRKNSLISRDTWRAIGWGGVVGLFTAWFLNLLFPTSFSVVVGFVFALGAAGQYYSNPLRRIARIMAFVGDSNESCARRSAPENAKKLEKLWLKRQTLDDRMQDLKEKLAAARRIVEA